MNQVEAGCRNRRDGVSRGEKGAISPVRPGARRSRIGGGLAGFALTFALFSGCSSSENPAPSGEGGSGNESSSKGQECERDADCDDGKYCNGKERCDPDSKDAAEDGCVAAERGPCGDNDCDEKSESCGCDEPDRDSDGHDSIECGGDDCDDDDPDRFPGNTEVCDEKDHDEDCDPTTYGFRDQDKDDDPDEKCCNIDEESKKRYCGTDCDDKKSEKHSFNTETCDDIDNDCDDLIDEDPDGNEDALKSTFTIDRDGDGFGDKTKGAETVVACKAPEGYHLEATDCDDTKAAINPGAFDSCEDDIDNDCSEVVNDPDGGCSCEGNISQTCGAAGAGLLGQCASFERQCNNGKWDDCPLLPGTQSEVCDGAGIDEDCDGLVDEALGSEVEGSLKTTYYRDRDNDAYPDLDTEALYCADHEPAGWITAEHPDDCVDVALGTDPASAAIHPGADEICNGRDDDCDGDVDAQDADAQFPDRPSVSGTTFSCVAGKWTISQCPANQLQCDADLNNGCETNALSLSDCGKCDNKCVFSCGSLSSKIQCIELGSLGAGSEHTCATLKSGKVACWGKGDLGRLGTGNANTIAAPALATVLSDAQLVVGGTAHTCAITGSNGALSCWGSNSSGQLGVGSTPGQLASSSSPLSLGTGYGQVALGDAHGCAISSGNLMCWGNRANGRLGDGATSGQQTSPVSVTDGYSAISDAAQVALGWGHTCYVSTSGTVHCVGDNTQRQLGAPTLYAGYFQQVPGLSSVTQIAAGYTHNCAVSGGEVWCWGSNSQGQSGQPGGGQVMSPTKVTGLSGVTALALGISHSCALAAGDVYCWGLGTSGQLGVDVDASSAPVRVGERSGSNLLGKADRLTSGGNHACARESATLSVKCWGADGSGQLGDGASGTGEDNDPTTIQPL